MPSTTQPTTHPTPSSSLATLAQETLRKAEAAKLDRKLLLREERNIRQPDSWLLERAWQILADRGSDPETGDAGITVAGLAEANQPLAVPQALYRLAQHVGDHPAQRPFVEERLERLRYSLFTPWVADENVFAERLLLAGATAARIGAESFAFACIERLDQVRFIWRQVFFLPELRALLAEIVALTPLHPLTVGLIRAAIPRHDEAGAHFLQTIAAVAATHIEQTAAFPARRVLQRCVDTVAHTTLISLISRRCAASVFARAGRISDIHDQVVTIATIQEARRESGIRARTRDADDMLLRHVSRSRANTDVDFQVYTLQEALNALPTERVRGVDNPELDGLLEMLVQLGVRSDGWTAASTASTLIGLGALKQAVRVVDKIAPDDATRSEGVVSLVRGLLAADEEITADLEVDKALAWVRSTDDRNLERVTIWGLAEAFLHHRQPQKALALLPQRRKAGLLYRIRKNMGKFADEEDLREDRIRLEAALLGDRGGMGDSVMVADDLFERIRTWSPKLLEGEALVTYYIRLLDALLRTDQLGMVWRLLPDVVDGLVGVGGNKHAVRANELALILAPLLQTDGPDRPQADKALRTFVDKLWQGDAKQGIWQAVYGIGGILPLLLALDGAERVADIASFTAQNGGGWGQIVEKVVRTGPHERVE